MGEQNTVADGAVVVTRAPVQVGDPAPDIQLPTADSPRWRLEEHRGRPVVLIFHRHLH